MDTPAPHGGGTPLDQPLSPSAACEARAQLRRAGEEELSERLYSIILAVHAARRRLEGDHGRLAEMLDLIHVQSTASMEDLRRLGGLR